nr:RHS repeat domain-containing protein [Pseudomonas koreensis]
MLGRQITRQDEFGAITQYQWDAADRLTQVTLPGGATRAFTYNPYSRVTAERDERDELRRINQIGQIYFSADGPKGIENKPVPDGIYLAVTT